jgi:hypothetical protein
MSSPTHEAGPEAVLAYIAASVGTGEWRVWTVAKPEAFAADNPKPKFKVERIRARIEDLVGVTCRPLRTDTKTASVRYAGTCPSCKHPTDQVIPLTFLTVEGSWKSIGVGARVRPRPQEEADNVALAPTSDAVGGLTAESRERIGYPVLVTCQCIQSHEAPTIEGSFGCGASWMLKAVTSDGRTVADGPHFALPADDELERWKDLAAIAAVNVEATKHARDAVGTWVTALTGLFALVGVVAAVGGREALMKINHPQAVVITIGVLAVLVISAGTALWGQLGATGVPVVRSSAGEEAVAEYADNPLEQAVESTTRLRQVVCLALVGFVVALLTLCLIWWAPVKTEPAKKVDVTFKSGPSATCVTTSDAADPRFILVKDKKGTVTVRRLGDVVAVKPARC